MTWRITVDPGELMDTAVLLGTSAVELADIMTGVCYSMQPSVMPVALRNRGSIRDFGAHRDALLPDTA